MIYVSYIFGATAIILKIIWFFSCNPNISIVQWSLIWHFMELQSHLKLLCSTEGKNFYMTSPTKTGRGLWGILVNIQYYLAGPRFSKLLALCIFILICTGFPINFVTLLVTAQNKKLRQPLNFILVDLAVARLIMVWIHSLLF